MSLLQRVEKAQQQTAEAPSPHAVVPVAPPPAPPKLPRNPAREGLLRQIRIRRVDSVLLNEEHVLRIIDRVITPMGRRIDESSPRVDARLPDGSRVNAVIEPLSLIGPVITVRKFAAKPYTVDDLSRFGTASAEMFEF